MAEKGDSTHSDGSWVPEVVGFGLIGQWARKVEVEAFVLAGFWTVVGLGAIVGFPLVNAFSTVFAFWAGAVFRAAEGFLVVVVVFAGEVGVLSGVRAFPFLGSTPSRSRDLSCG